MNLMICMSVGSSALKQKQICCPCSAYAFVTKWEGQARIEPVDGAYVFQKTDALSSVFFYQCHLLGTCNLGPGDKVHYDIDIICSEYLCMAYALQGHSTARPVQFCNLGLGKGSSMTVLGLLRCSNMQERVVAYFLALRIFF